MQCLKKIRQTVFALLLVAGVVSVLSWQRTLSGTRAADSLQFDVSALVHGFATAPGLPDGDLFLLPKPLKFTLNHPPESVALFKVGDGSFGDEAQTMGALPEVPARGFSLTTPGESGRALLCAESIREGNFFLAANGAVGDTVRIFVQQGEGEREWLSFTVEAEGFRLNKRHGHLKLFVDNRFALGPDARQGALIPFADEAGPRGKRTGLLTLAFPQDANAPLPGCFQLGIELRRAQAAGTLSVAVADLVVNRNRVAGDENNPGEGLLGKLTGGYPSSFTCNVDCPFPID